MIRRRLSPFVLIAVAVLAAVSARAAAPSDADLARQLDAVLQPAFPPDKPGLVILVARDGQPVYRRAFGLANVEKKTPMRPENALRIASVTKQFTATLIMQLVDQGKLSLTDDVATYVPALAQPGRVTTIEHLLTHTSGVFDYTNAVDMQTRMNQPLTHEHFLTLLHDKPYAFAPGEKWQYANSGYYILGMVIEKVTGRTYAQCLQDGIFTPLGMKNSGYGKNTPSLPNEVPGYTSPGDSVRAANPIDMSWPFAAGAIVSTVDDMLRWDNGITAGRAVSAASRARMLTAYTLKDGTSAGYGYGWVIGDLFGHRTEWHNGGINGFSSEAMRLPDDHAYIVMITNDDDPAANSDFLVQKVAAIVIGQPLPEKGQYTMTPEQLDRFVGVYALDSTTTRTITRDGNTLYSQRSGGARIEIFPTSDSTFGFVERPATLTFGRDARGAVDRCTIRQGGITQVFLKTNAAPPAERSAVALTSAQLDACVGEYEIAPTFHITVTRAGDALKAQATGQPQFDIFPESPTKFFLKVVDAQIEFTPGADGKMESMTLHQAGQHIPGKRVK